MRIYICVGVNRLRIRNVSNQKEIELTAAPPFSHSRTVLGTFSVAESLLRQGVAQVKGGGLLRWPPVIMIHPTENIEGGLTQIEQRAFRELGMAAGGCQVKVWDGPELDDAQVLRQLDQKG